MHSPKPRPHGLHPGWRARRGSSGEQRMRGPRGGGRGRRRRPALSHRRTDLGAYLLGQLPPPQPSPPPQAGPPPPASGAPAGWRGGALPRRPPLGSTELQRAAARRSGEEPGPQVRSRKRSITPGRGETGGTGGGGGGGHRRGEASWLQPAALASPVHAGSGVPQSRGSRRSGGGGAVYAGF